MIEMLRSRMQPKLFEMEGVSAISHCCKENRMIIYVEDDEYIDAMPTYAYDFPVEVRTIGRLEFIIDRKAEIRPLLGGISIGNKYATGTLSLITYDGYILSNAHVIALNDEGEVVLEDIYQPGLVDGGKEIVGGLVRSVDIIWNDTENVNYCDAAIASLDVEGYEGIILLDDKGLVVSDIVEVVVGNKIKKSGRTTGLTEHDVIDVHAAVKVWWSEDKWAIFDDCILVEPAPKPGDSGSLAYTDNNIVGLIFAGSPKVGVICKAKYVVEELGVELGKPVVKPPEEVEEVPDTAKVFALVGGLIIASILSMGAGYARSD